MRPKLPQTLQYYVHRFEVSVKVTQVMAYTGKYLLSY